MRLMKWPTAYCADIVETFVGIFLPEEKILHRDEMSRIFVILKRATVRNEEIELAVIVKVDEGSSPTNVIVGDTPQSNHVSNICKEQCSSLFRATWRKPQVIEKSVPGKSTG